MISIPDFAKACKGLGRARKKALSPLAAFSPFGDSALPVSLLYDG